MENKKYQWLKDIATVLVFFVCFVGCFIWWQRKNDSEQTISNNTPTTTQESIDQYKRNRYGDPVTTTCTFCGGIGKVGYAGESEAQIKRTGNGLGNICNVCKGSGKIKTYPKEPQ